MFQWPFIWEKRAVVVLDCQIASKNVYSAQSYLNSLLNLNMILILKLKLDTAYRN